MTTVIDYGTGNLRSVADALGRLGCEYRLSADPREIASARRVILPGVGQAASAMEKLRATGLVETIKSLSCPVLGICIGMQLMCRRSEEGDTACMGIFDTEVVRLPGGEGLKVPHMGWDTITGLSSAIFDGLGDGEYVYYVHSFAPQLSADTIAVTGYGMEFSAALGSGNFYGTQFHPEKSGVIGEKILDNFLRL